MQKCIDLLVNDDNEDDDNNKIMMVMVIITLLPPAIFECYHINNSKRPTMIYDIKAS